MTKKSTTPAASPAQVSPSPGRVTRWQKAIGVLGLLVLLWVGDRLYDVIDGGTTGRGGDHRPAGAPTSQPAGTSDLSAGGTGGGGHAGHDPSRFGHG